MKIQLTKIETKKDSITVFDGEKDIIIPSEKYQDYLLSENAIPISGFVPNLDNLTVSGTSVYKVAFKSEQNQKQIELNKNHLEIKPTTFTELQAYTFDPNKKYRVHLNQDCMNNTGSYDSPLPKLIRSNPNIVELVVEGDVTSINQKAFSSCRNLTAINILYGAKLIDSAAFENCVSLKSVSIPNSISSIKNSAFWGCENITSLYIPSSVTSFEDVFQNCFNLSDINVSKENKNYSSINGILYNKNFTSLIKYPINKKDSSFKVPDNITSISNSAFSDCSHLESISLPESIISIGENAFNNCTKLTSINIPKKVTIINKGTFSNTNLASVSIPESVTSIGGHAFYNCTNLSSINIPDGVTSIGEFTFYCCKRLPSICIPNKVASIGIYTFEGCSQLSEITYIGTKEQWNAISKDNIRIPNNCKIICLKDPIELPAMSFAELSSYNFDSNKTYKVHINQDCMSHAGKYTTELSNFFRNHSDIEMQVVIDNDVTVIEEKAFEMGRGITSVVIPDSVTSIKKFAFNGCWNIPNIVLPKDLTVITEESFARCDKLKSISIGNKVTTIEYQAFFWSTGIKEITLPESISNINEYSLASCSGLTTLNILNPNISIGRFACSGCYNLKHINYAGTRAQWDAIMASASVLVNHENYKVHCSDDPIEVPAMTFAELQTYNFEATKKYSIHVNQDCMNNAGNYNSPLPTFIQSKTNIVNIIIDDDVTSISEYAFYGCINLVSASIGNRATSIGNYSFRGCSKLILVTIGNNIISIGNCAFGDCSNLTSVSIPESVTKMGDIAFFTCNKLSSITYMGTGEQWNAIQGLSNAQIPSNCIIHCTDGDITIQ